MDVKLVTGTNWTEPRTVQHLHGGQGTINVNSWAPDSQRFAYVSYPIVGQHAGRTFDGGGNVIQ